MQQPSKRVKYPPRAARSSRKAPTAFELRMHAAPSSRKPVGWQPPPPRKPRPTSVGTSVEFNNTWGNIHGGAGKPYNFYRQ